MSPTERLAQCVKCPSEGTCNQVIQEDGEAIGPVIIVSSMSRERQVM